MSLFHRLFPLDYIFTYVEGNKISNRVYLLQFIKRRSKVHQGNMSQEQGLNFDQ